MGYSESLSKMVQKSGLTLKDLAEKCGELGQKIDPSYISKLQTGKQPPASDEINKSIALACDADPDILLYEAYIEKAPEFIKQFIAKLILQARSSAKILLTELKSSSPLNSHFLIDEMIEQASDTDIIKMFLSFDNNFLEKQGDSLLLKDHEKNDVKLIVNDLFGLQMPDNSMSPIIDKGVKIQLDSGATIRDGDIILALLSDNTFLIRRYIPYENKIILIAENSSFPPLTLQSSEIKIGGRVKSITKEF